MSKPENGGTPRPGEHGFFETFDFKEKIESKINAQYPLINGNSDVFDAFMRGDHHYCAIGPATDQTKRTHVFIEGLRRAQDEQSIEFSHHGAEHKTYTEVLQTMISFLQDGQARIQAGSKIIPIDQKSTLRHVHTFVLEGPPFERQAFMPRPLTEASNIQADPQNLFRIARKYALDPDRGYAFALLFLTFKGIPSIDIKNALSNRQWLRDIGNAIPGRVIRDGQQDGLIITDFLHRTLMVADSNGTIRPTTDPTHYQTAIQYLKDHKFSVQGQALGFAETTLRPRPIVVLTGATEIAEKIASPDFLDPVRHKWIFDKYGNTVTTKIKTAYLIFD